MKKIIYILSAVVVIAAVSCSKKFEELQANPNVPVSVPPDLIFNTLDLLY